MGVTMALPLLDSMVPAQTPLSKTAATPPTRLACIEMVRVRLRRYHQLGLADAALAHDARPAHGI
jgi:hypothetical protein